MRANQPHQGIDLNGPGLKRRSGNENGVLCVFDQGQEKLRPDGGCGLEHVSFVANEEPVGCAEALRKPAGKVIAHNGDLQWVQRAVCQVVGVLHQRSTYRVLWERIYLSASSCCGSNLENWIAPSLVATA